MLEENKCWLCNLEEQMVLENELAFAIWDDTPVSKGHIIFATKRHVKDFFGTTSEERDAIFKLVDKAKKIIDKKYSPTGYNIGINCGVSAGQTAMHVHVHLIPRYDGDVEDPTGGVRGVIPERQKL